MRLLSRLAIVFAVFLGMYGCTCREPSKSLSPMPAANAARPRGEGAVLMYLAAAMGTRQTGCRLYYRGPYEAVSPDGFYLPQVGFPRTLAHPPPNGKTGVAAVRAVFQGDKNVVVRQGQSGLIRVYIGKVSSAILRTRLRPAKFSPDDQYSPGLAIDAIVDSREVTAAARRLEYRNDQYILDIAFSGPAAGVPHLPPVLTNLSMDRALDRVAETFGVTVLYGECAKPGGGHLFDVRYSADCTGPAIRRGDKFRNKRP